MLSSPSGVLEVKGDNYGVGAWGGWILRGLAQTSRVCSSAAAAVSNNEPN